MKWKRYRFKTKSVEDWRPLVYNPQYPSWCSGYDGEMTYAIMIAYLPEDEDLLKYWDDAYDIDSTEHERPEFSDRFPKPKGYIEPV